MKDNFWVILVCVFVIVGIFKISMDGKQLRLVQDKRFQSFLSTQLTDTVWIGSPASQIPYYRDSGHLIYYGYKLIRNTSYYLGRQGKVARIANDLNCQNCHLDAGTRPFGNNFGKVFATYPEYRARNNAVQTVYQRINDCMVRSLNGQPLDSGSVEAEAIYAYIKWLDKDVAKNVVRGGTKLRKLPLLSGAANPVKGEKVYVANCQICHGSDGYGQVNNERTAYTYPPLWGPDSYNDGAGMFRLKTIAAFVYNNMPFGVDYHHPQLTGEEAWDVGAYVNSQPRPHFDRRGDWPLTEKKPVDYPFGPYIEKDTFPESQHKYGPYASIEAVYQ